MNPLHVSSCECDDCRLPEHDTERQKIDAWRLHELLEAGYAVAHAERLAVRHDVDLHRAVDLVGHGCKPDLAAEILL